MICEKCLQPCEKRHWLNNSRVCEVCLHNSRPASSRCNEVEDIPPTMKNLKKLWERKNGIKP